MPQDIPKPAYDPELTDFIAAIPGIPGSRDVIAPLRKAQEDASTLENTLGNRPFTHDERSVPGPNGPVTLAIFTPKTGSDKARPVIYNMHMGGMIVGTRLTGLGEPLDWAEAIGAVCIGVEYRLAPEYPFPAGTEDCYAGLQWVSSHASDLNVDPARILVSGQSAGGNLAAAMTLMARDRNGPQICAQLLDCGMFDDTMATVASRQFMDDGMWTGHANKMAWDAILGPNAGKQSGVSPYAAVLRATDLSNLPPALVTVGSAELFRDEDIAYAQKLWAAGVPTELHVWPGGYHCFDMLVPDAAVSKASRSTKLAWVKKTVGQLQAKL